MASLVKQLPELDAMERSFRRMFEGISLIPAFVQPPVPATDVYETPEEIVYELEVPGFAENELGLEISGHRLTLKGEHEQVEEEQDKLYRVHERVVQHFERTFVVPPEVDAEHITAVIEDGVLKVHAPKIATLQPRKIAIEA